MAIAAWSAKRDQGLGVVVGERAVFFGNVEIAAVRHPADHRHRQQAAHRRMARRKADRARILADVLEPQPLALVQGDAQEAAAARRIADLPLGREVDPGGDEGADPVLGVDHRDRAVAGAEQAARPSTIVCSTVSRERSALTTRPAACSCSSSWF